MSKFFIGFFLFIGLAVGIFFILGKNPQSPNTSGKIQITTSFYPLYFFASQIGGDKAQVYNITPASSEPHDYEPTTQDIVKINQSNMLILNGIHLEAWGDKIKNQLEGSNVLIITTADGLANKKIQENGQTIQDPHIWLDPLLAKKQVVFIEKAYEKIDPKNATYFQQNAKKLETQLDQLDMEYKSGLSSCQRKDFVTSHAAFGYLASAYGLNQIAISGISPDEEPSSQKLAQIADLVKKENITVIFFESLVTPKLSQTLASETHAKTMVLNPIEGLTEKDLNEGKNYFTVMRENLFALQDALQCSR